MFKIDRDLARHELDALPLSEGSRRFASWWLSQIAADGSPLQIEKAKPVPGDLAASTLICEVRAWGTVLCRSSGDVINRALGLDLAGRDMLALVSPAQRAARFSRYGSVGAGGVLFAYRSVTAADGTKFRIQELLLPCPDRRVAMIDKGAALTIGYLDSTQLASGTRLLISQGALNLADEPKFIDFRPSPLMAASA